MTANGTYSKILDHHLQERTGSHIIRVNNRPVEVYLFSNARLAQFPLLPQLVSVINRAYSAGHVSGTKEYFPSNLLRLESSQALVEELGPDCFTFVVTQSMAEETDPGSPSPSKHLTLRRVLGTASGRPFTRPRVVMNVEPAPMSPWVPKIALQKLDDPDIVQWELKLMGVDPSLQKQGLASHMIDLVTEEIKRRVEGEKREVWMVFTTMKELNGPYYSKRGFLSVSETVIEPGHMGSREGFTISELAKRIV